ncbi:UNVERIFIED_CONTAM: hypothetical protein FKN15_064026 [Acipenser sinensis]
MAIRDPLFWELVRREEVDTVDNWLHLESQAKEPKCAQPKRRKLECPPQEGEACMSRAQEREAQVSSDQGRAAPVSSDREKHQSPEIREYLLLPPPPLEGDFLLLPTTPLERNYLLLPPSPDDACSQECRGKNLISQDF